MAILSKEEVHQTCNPKQNQCCGKEGQHRLLVSTIKGGKGGVRLQTREETHYQAFQTVTALQQKQHSKRTEPTNRKQKQLRYTEMFGQVGKGSCYNPLIHLPPLRGTCTRPVSWVTNNVLTRRIEHMKPEKGGPCQPWVVFSSHARVGAPKSLKGSQVLQ